MEVRNSPMEVRNISLEVRAQVIEVRRSGTRSGLLSGPGPSTNCSRVRDRVRNLTGSDSRVRNRVRYQVRYRVRTWKRSEVRGPNSEEVRGPRSQLGRGPRSQVGQNGTSSGESLGGRKNDLYVICFKAIIEMMILLCIHDIKIYIYNNVFIEYPLKGNLY